MSEININDHNALFEMLAKRLRGNVVAQQKVTAHIRTKHGHSTLPSFHNNGATPEEKASTYQECLRAVLKNNYDELQGQVGDGQARVETPEVETKPEKVPVPEPTKAVEASEAVDPVEMATNLIRSIQAGLTPKQSGVSEARVRELVDEVVNDRSEKAAERVLELTKSAIDELRKAIRPSYTFHVEAKDPVTLEEASHWQLPQVATWIGANIPVWLWGAAGGGKTHLARQIAKALSLKPNIVSVDPTMSIGKLLGYRNLSTGEFMEGFLYRPYKEGGLVMADEIDTGDPGILAGVNSMLANGHYLFPNGEEVERHKDFRFMAGANSKGMGATAGYVARNRLDAATLDRFAIIELKYDNALESYLATGTYDGVDCRLWNKCDGATEDMVKEWVRWVQKVRENVGNSVLVSPRASILGAKALRVGIVPDEVAEALVFRLCSSDTKESIIRRCGQFGGVK